MLAVCLLGLLLSASACSSGSSEPSAVRLIVEADYSALYGQGDIAALNQARQIMELRAIGYDADHISVQESPPQRVIANITGIKPESARRLLTEQGLLVFNRPAIAGDGIVTCRATSGERFSAPPTVVGGRTICAGTNRAGEIDWVSAPVAVPPIAGSPDGDSVTRVHSWLISADGKSLSAEWNQASDALLQELNGYPLGIFLDGRLIAAPIIHWPLMDRRQVMATLDPEEARVLFAELNSGALPAPFHVVTGSEAP